MPFPPPALRRGSQVLTGMHHFDHGTKRGAYYKMYVFLTKVLQAASLYVAWSIF